MFGTIPLRVGKKECVFAKHDLIASNSLRFRSEKIRYPPGADLPDEEQGIANHDSVLKPGAFLV